MIAGLINPKRPKINSMNARLVLVTIFLLLLIRGFSQDKDSIPAPGVIDKRDLLMSECAFDKEAEALVLFDVGKIVFKAYVKVNTETTRRFRIKILSNKGLEQATVKIRYLIGEYGETLTIEDARTYNIDSKGNIVVTRVDKSGFSDKELNKRIAERSFTFPAVRVGSVIECSYKVSGFLISGSGMKPWQFQREIPVKFSRYTVQFPNELTLHCNPEGSIPLLKQNSNEWSDTVHIYTATDVPALRTEPHMTCIEDYKQKLTVTVDTVKEMGRVYVFPHNWSFISFLIMKDEDLGKQLLKDLPNTEAVDNGLNAITDPYHRMMFVYYYVKNNMHLNDQDSIWWKGEIMEAWKKKNGTNTEISLILINLLKKAGLQPLPLMVSTHAHGKLDNTNPTMDQFNKLMVFVNINDHDYVLDAADKYSSPKLIPWDVQYSNQLVIRSNGTIGHHQLGVENELKPFWDKKAAFREVVQVQGNIDDAGLLTGDATVTSYDYSREKKMPDLQKGKEYYLDKYYIAGNSAIHLDSNSLTNEKTDTLPLKQQVWFKEKLRSSGIYKYFSPNLFSGFDKNPFTASQRFSDVFFGANQDYNIVENIFIPDGYSFDALPKDTTTNSPDGTIVFRRNINHQNDMISIHISIVFKSPSYLAIEYNDIKAFYDKMISMLNEQVVIKKNV